MAGETIEKLKMSVNRGITTIGVKTSASLEKSKILTHIDSLDKDNRKAYAALGEEAYRLWKNGEKDFSLIYEGFEQIKKRKEDIEKLTVQLNSIEEKNNEILGKKETAEEETVTKIFCSNCGEAYDTSVKFCRKCGSKME